MNKTAISNAPLILLKDSPFDAFEIDDKGEKHLNELPSMSWPSLTNFADTIVNKVIPTLYPDTPLLISGDWGAGKTSVLKYEQNRLDSIEKVKRTIWFDAWYYEKEASLLQALIRTIWAQYQQVNSCYRTELKELVENTLLLAGAIGTRFLTGLVGVRGGLKEFASDIGQLDKRIPVSNSIDDLVISLQLLIERLWGKNAEIVVFIDDLDRCSPASAVELLESIRSLVNNTISINCKFVVIMDRVTLSEVVRNKYSAMSSYDANRYLEKMFPYSFNVPHPGGAEVAILVTKLINKFNRLNTDCRLLDECEPKFISILSKPEYANPRLIKRCINRFAFYRSIAQDNGDIDFDDLILWLATIERWPILRRLLLRKQENFWLDFYLDMKSHKHINEPDGAELVLQPGIREFFIRFDKDNIMLQMKRFKALDMELSRYGL